VMGAKRGKRISGRTGARGGGRRSAFVGRTPARVKAADDQPPRRRRSGSAFVSGARRSHRSPVRAPCIARGHDAHRSQETRGLRAVAGMVRSRVFGRPAAPRNAVSSAPSTSGTVTISKGGHGGSRRVRCGWPDHAAAVLTTFRQEGASPTGLTGAGEGSI
jgi:hypothetical protein